MEVEIATVGVFLVTLAATAGALGVIARSAVIGRPLRWLWRTNVSDPLGHWFKAGVAEVVDERIDYLMHNRNSGSSLLDLAESLDVVKGNVAMLLTHDAERDTAGKRYGGDGDKEAGDSV